MSGARKRKCLDAVQHPLVEGPLPIDGEDADEKAWQDLRNTRVPLKNGGDMEFGWARAWEKQLRNLLERHPDHYRTLQALVEGRREEANEQHIRDLQKGPFLDLDGMPWPGVQAVMKAAHRETPDGPTLVNPLEVRTTEAADLVQEFDEQRAKRHREGAERLLGKLLDPGRDQDDGPRR